jgi:ABC-type branched-subunit amino acid transport system ATPase component
MSHAPSPAVVADAPVPIARGEGLVAENLQRYYGKWRVVNDVTIQVRKGEVVGLLGPNGAGKTTSFYMIVGLLKPTRAASCSTGAISPTSRSTSGRAPGSATWPRSRASSASSRCATT